MPDVEHPLRVVVMGVTGAGKSAVGRRLTNELGAEFVEGDDLHPPANVAKMAAGEPLTDDDRWPWLDLVAERLAWSDRVVVTCSALKRAYRDRLRRAGHVRFVLLSIDEETAAARVAGRRGHFMPAGLVASQFDALEMPGSDEPDVTVLDGTQRLLDVVGAVDARLGPLRER